ncbi:hypothetical protein AB1Y20_020497 [Prymnesium parvum]|uniref:Uncharacterized protein n=1 Tax=Prymnesium parvum TaxID=97485 RepID=A0AB34JTU7_PRYPA
MRGGDWSGGRQRARARAARGGGRARAPAGGREAAARGARAPPRRHTRRACARGAAAPSPGTLRPAVGWAPREAAAAGGGGAAGACGRVAEAAAPHAAAERATEAAAALIKQLEAMLPRTAGTPPPFRQRLPACYRARLTARGAAGPADAAQAALPSPAPEAAFAAPAAFSVAAACHPSSGPGEHASLLQSLADEIAYVRSTAYATEVIRSAVLHRRQDPATQRHRLVAAHDRARQAARAAARHRAGDAALSEASLAPSGHEGRSLSPTQRASEERFARARRAVASQRAWCSSSLRTSRRAGEGTVTLSNDRELREADGEGRPSEAACAMSSSQVAIRPFARHASSNTPATACRPRSRSAGGHSQEAPIISPEALVCLRIAEESQADPSRDECCRRYDGGVPAWAATTQPSARSAARDTRDAACGDDGAADRTAPRPPVAAVPPPCSPRSADFVDSRPPLAPQHSGAASRPLDALPSEDVASEPLLDVLQRTFKRVDLSGLGVAPLAHVLRGLRSALASEAAQLRSSVWVPPLQALCNKLEARLEAAQLSQAGGTPPRRARAALEFLAIEWEDLTRLATSATDHKLHEYVRGHEAPAATGGAERTAAASRVDSVLANVGGVARSFELQGRGGRGMSRADEGKLLASSARCTPPRLLHRFSFASHCTCLGIPLANEPPQLLRSARLCTEPPLSAFEISAVRSAALDLDGAILSSVASSIVVEGTAADPGKIHHTKTNPLRKEEHEARYFVSCTGDEVQEVVAASPSARRGPTDDDLPAARRQAHAGHGPAASESPTLPLIEPSSTALVAPYVAGGSGMEHASRAASCTQARVVQPTITSTPPAAPIRVLGRAVVAPTTTSALAAGVATPQQGATPKVVPALSVVVTKPAPKPA